jgi:hypothetical protein
MAAFERLAHGLDVADALERKSAPPPVRSTTACTTLSRPTSSGLMKSVIPNFLAISALAGLRSIPIIRSAPTILAPWITFSPMPPSPNTHDIGARPDLRSVDHRAMPVVTAAADVADLVEGRVFPDLRHRDSGRTVKFAKVLQPM